jgi:hypothetical protein
MRPQSCSHAVMQIMQSCRSCSHADHAVAFSTLTQPCVSSYCVMLMNCVIGTVSACSLCTRTFFFVCLSVACSDESHITTQHTPSEACATSPTPTLHQYACCEKMGRRHVFLCVCQLPVQTNLTSQRSTHRQRHMRRACVGVPTPTSHTPTLHQYACCEITDLRHVFHTLYAYAPHAEVVGDVHCVS